MQWKPLREKARVQRKGLIKDRKTRGKPRSGRAETEEKVVERRKVLGSIKWVKVVLPDFKLAFGSDSSGVSSNLYEMVLGRIPREASLSGLVMSH